MADAAMSGLLREIATHHFARYLDWQTHGKKQGREGKESHPNTVFLLVYDLPDKDDPFAILREDALDFISEEPYKPKKIASIEEILSYIGKCDDGACALNMAENTIAHVGEINNNPCSLPDNYNVYLRIPPDFVHYNGDPYRRSQIGMKTRAAFKAVDAASNNGYEDFSAIITKETAYGNPFVGMALRIGGNELEEYYLLSPEYESSIPKMQIRHRMYQDNNPVPVDEQANNEFYSSISKLLRAMEQPMAPQDMKIIPELNPSVCESSIIPTQ